MQHYSLENHVYVKYNKHSKSDEDEKNYKKFNLIKA